MLYHFTLTYSNWEFVQICFSESYESLSEGFQKALFYLSKAPKVHQTDSLSSAIINNSKSKDFTSRYAALLRHYGIEGRRTQPFSPNENGDIELSYSMHANSYITKTFNVEELFEKIKYFGSYWNKSVKLADRKSYKKDTGEKNENIDNRR